MHFVLSLLMIIAPTSFVENLLLIIPLSINVSFSILLISFILYKIKFSWNKSSDSNIILLTLSVIT